MDSLPETFVVKLRAEVPEIQSIYLFGSRARGDFHPASDYDLLVVVPEKDAQLKRKLHAVAEDFWQETGRDFSLKIFSEAQFNTFSKMPTPFLSKVLTEGKKIG